MSHPTILIGYGAYGLRVLHTFLAGAAARGALAWDEQGTVGSLNERKLHSLSLLWIADPLEAAEQLDSGGLGESSYELMDDLFAQVECVEGSFKDVREKLADAVDREKKRLLDAGRRGEANIAGLDVIVVAQPMHQETIGFLRDGLEPAMLRLASDPAFLTVQEGGGDTLLNFIQILDFDEYWAPRTEPVRDALRQVLEEQPDAFAAGRPTVGRVYLFDSNTAAGHRSPESRLQEEVLFLELLLLEGLRNSPEARALYRRERIDVPPVCSVGVRVVQRSSGLLRRLAAAAFARNWLAHIGSTTGSDSGVSPLAELVSPFREDRLAATIGERELVEFASREAGRIEQALLAVSPSEPDWGERLSEVAERETEAAILRLSARSGSQSGNLAKGVLNTFRQELERSITTAMQERSPAQTLGAVIDELKRMEDAFGAAAAGYQRVPDPPDPSAEVFGEAGRMQREYVMYLSRQVQTARMGGRWWPRAAILFALALSPAALRGISEAAPDLPVPIWVQTPVVAAVLGALFWLIGRRAIQPLLDRTAERAREFYTDPERGRLAERVRRIAGSSSVAGRLEMYSRLLVFGLKQYVLGAVAAELQRARDILQKRREEVGWLQRQVGEFLVSNQVDAGGSLPAFQEGGAPSDVRFSLERTEDLQAVAQSVPRDASHFREFVASQQLFAAWARPYCDTFLHPLPFLDQLSQRFHDRLELDEDESRRRAARITSLVENEVHISVCFRWLMADSLPPPRRGSLFPSVWNPLHGVRLALSTAGFEDRVIETPNTERMYLFEGVLGVPTELLVSSK